MIDMDGLPDSLFVSKLCHFLDNPVIRIESTPSEEVAALKKEVEELKQANDVLRLKYDRLVSQYGDEVNRCLCLEDFCRAHGLNWR